MGLALFAFVAIFLLVGSAGLLLFLSRKDDSAPVGAISPPSEGSGWSRLKFNRAGTSLKAVVQPFEGYAEEPAGSFRSTNAPYSRRLPPRCPYADFVWRQGAYSSLVVRSCRRNWRYSVTSLFRLYGRVSAGLLRTGFLAGPPDPTRQVKIRLGLPDFLDLMVVCIEAGLSLDQALPGRETNCAPASLKSPMKCLGIPGAAGRASARRCLEAFRGASEYRCLHTLVASSFRRISSARASQRPCGCIRKRCGSSAANG